MAGGVPTDIDPSEVPPQPSTGVGLGLSSTASTPQIAQPIVDSSHPAWKHCSMPDVKKKNSLKCNYCLNTYTGGITRIKYHLAKVPKSGVAKCKKVPKDVLNEMLKLLSNKIDAKNSKARDREINRAQVDLSHSEGEEESDDGGNAAIVIKSMRQDSSSGGPMEKYCKLTPEEVVGARKGKGIAEKVQSKISTEKREEKRDRAYEYICQFFYEAGIPHNTALLPSFELMVEAIGDFGRNLRVPTPYEMSGKFLQKRKKRVLDSLKAHKDSRELSGCTLMTDAWTDKRGRGVMNLVAHSAYGVYFLNSVDCSAAKKDGQYIFELIDKCTEDIGEHNVVQVVTDNARVNETASAILKAKRPSLFWNGCAAHCIDLMLEDIGKVPAVEKTISKAKSLMVFLYAHTRVLDLMRKFVGKDLIRRGITRFATAYLNLKSLQDNKKQLMRLFRSDELNEMGYLNKAKGKEACKVVRAETFWKGVDTAVHYFEPLAIVLRRMDSDVPAMGFLYGCLLEAKAEITARFNHDISRYQQVLDIIDKRWDNKLKTPLHRAGYYLNLYYYYQNKLDIELDGSFRDAVITCITKLVHNAEVQDQIILELQKYQDEYGSFGRDIAKRQWKNKHFDPAKWWMDHGTTAPNLRKMASRILGLTCSSSACERNWSVYEQVHTKGRNKLQHERMKDLVFVKFNSKLKQKKENTTRDPIEKVVADVLEDENNEWITGIVSLENAEQEEEPLGVQVEGGSSAHGATAKAQQKRKRGVKAQHGNMKRKKFITILEEKQASSSS